MKLRLATVNDLPDLVMLGKQLHQESTFSTMDYDGEIVKQSLTDLINKNQFVVVTEDINGIVIGVMAGSVTQSWFGNDLIASDLVLLVRQDRRGGLIAHRLIQHFVHWAKLAGAKQIRPGVTTGNESAQALYERLGFKRCGSTYFMEGV
ncbi:MAG: hypothetical protein B7X60_08535 [Polynucleobacter sp. 39-45-136]|jgi:GNAT superfamily N-acetyltransferase|nr:MAG: hypothetical protein B7X60_08535 [Polynucleobacter sp. 39-45-136]